jgi:hypothetical protein
MYAGYFKDRIDTNWHTGIPTAFEQAERKSNGIFLRPQANEFSHPNVIIFNIASCLMAAFDSETASRV